MANLQEAPKTPEPTKEEVDRHYTALVDSVSVVLNRVSVKPAFMTEEERVDDIRRNVQHMEVMAAKTFWGDHDMDIVKTCIAKGNAFLEKAKK